MNKERERILTGNIAPVNRLFDLGSAEVFHENNLLLDPTGMPKFGQQDCKDFFICISENRKHWPKVFGLFTVELESFTTCTNCGNVSSQNNGSVRSTFITLECPNENISMSELIENKLNSFETMEGWKDEDGCQQKALGRNSTRIKDITRTNNLIIIVNRLIEVDGNLEIINKKVPLGGNILLEDLEENSRLFTPIAVIHHRGGIYGNTTRGHYQADVFNSASNQWMRTSDDEEPIMISKEEITEEGYIFLYKKSQR